MFIAALSAASCLAQAESPTDAAIDAFAVQSIEDAVLRYTTGRHPIYRGEVVFSRGESTYTYAVTGTLTSFGDGFFSSTYLSLASASSVALSVTASADGYTVLLSDEAMDGWPSPTASVAAGGFSADPLTVFEALTLPETPYLTSAGGAGSVSLTLERVPAAEVAWEDLVSVSRAAPAAGLDLSRAASRSQVLPLEGGRLVRGAVTGVPLEIRDSDPSCATYYTYWRGVDVALDVSIADDLTPTLLHIARGQERTDEQCSW